MRQEKPKREREGYTMEEAARYSRVISIALDIKERSFDGIHSIRTSSTVEKELERLRKLVTELEFEMSRIKGWAGENRRNKRALAVARSMYIQRNMVVSMSKKSIAYLEARLSERLL